MRVFDRACGTWAIVAGSAAFLLLVTQTLGCASSRLGDEGFRHAEHGYRLPHPPASEGVTWRIVSVDDAQVAYRIAGEAYMALDSRCEQPVAEQDPAVLGRQLLVGIANRERLESDAFAFAGGRAYAQVVEAEDEAGRRVRTRTVTLVRDGCVIDWVLVVEPGHPELEAGFEAWWRGFEPREDAKAGRADALAEVTP